ncbi:unnamed protein product [Pylaiella littoralis]
MVYARASAAVRTVATVRAGGKSIACSFPGFHYPHDNSSSSKVRVVISQRNTSTSNYCYGGASRSLKNGHAVCGEDRRDVGTSSPAPASIEGGDIKFSATAAATAAASSLGQQQQRWNLPPSIDALPATPIASQPTTFHDSFTERSPGLQRQQQKQQQRGQHQKQRQKLPESAGEAAAAATVAAEAAGAPADHPQILNPVEAFPMDTELRREIGAAVDTEMHRKLGATVAAATAAPGAALHPDVAAVHERVVAEEETAAAAAVPGVPMVNFDDTAVSYASFSNVELLRAYMVLRACAIRPLVENSETLLKIGYKVVGETITNAVLGNTFFAHFCAGETAEQVGRRARALKTRGIGGILDYAAEVDLRPSGERAERAAKRKEAGDDRLLLEEPAACRTYDYMGEAACDARLMTFLTCVRAVRDQTPGGFAAVKLTALGDPVLLSQITTCAHLVRRLFEDFDVDGNGFVDHKEFEEGYRRWFRSESDEDQAALLALMRRLDPKSTGVIDYVGWSNRMRLDNLADIVSHCRIPGPMAAAALREEGVALKKTMHRRIATLATFAADSEVRLMIDAEQSWLQPAIDNEVYSLQLEFNKEFPTIFTTYQCYLKDSLQRLEVDLERAARGGYVWAGKLVRGAYMVSERERANEEGYESPVFDTIEETHASYDAAVTLVLEHMARGNRAEVMMATHNQASIQHAIALMQKLGIRRRQDGVSFGQLLGMADNVTFPLGLGGYKAYKYIPYGKVGETIPYLLRRAQENSGMLSEATHERGLLVKEIGRRIFGGKKEIS